MILVSRTDHLQTDASELRDNTVSFGVGVDLGRALAGIWGALCWLRCGIDKSQELQEDRAPRILECAGWKPISQVTGLGDSQLRHA